MNQIVIIVLVVVYILWMIYAGWSAPLMEEREDGSFRTIRPEKKLKDLFKKKSKSGTISDLEKLGRGRSKY